MSFSNRKPGMVMLAVGLVVLMAALVSGQTATGSAAPTVAAQDQPTLQPTDPGAKKRAYLRYMEAHQLLAQRPPAIREALIATGFPYHNFDRIKGYMRTIDYFFNNTHGVRRLGSAATDLAYVACGRFDGFYEYNLSPWDVAAGALILRQAGGIVTDFRGGDEFLFGREIVAGNKDIFDEFLYDVGRFMNL